MRSFIVMGVILGSAASSQAAIFATDLSAPGDGLITRDTATNLDWLDWTQGLGFSYQGMLTELQPGGQYDGWRYATVSELHTLMANAGAPDPGGRTTGNVPAVTAMLGLLGANDFYGFLGAGNTSAAFVHDPANSPPGAFGPFGVLTIETFDSPVTAKAGEIGIGLNNVPFGLGHALVRTVPTPGAAALLGLAGLSACRRRR